MSGSTVSPLYNACDSLLSGWAEFITDKLERNEEPTPEEWNALEHDLEWVKGMVRTIVGRRDSAE